MSKFAATMNKGFALTFDNGYSISVQWGPNNYCGFRDLKAGFFGPMKTPDGIWRSETAEIQILDNNDNAVTNKFVATNDDVAGWLSSDEIAAIIAKVAAA